MHPDAMKEALMKQKSKGIDLTITIEAPEQKAKEEAEETDMAPPGKPLEGDTLEEVKEGATLDPMMGKGQEQLETVEGDPEMEAALQEMYGYDLHGKKPGSIGERISAQLAEKKKGALK